METSVYGIPFLKTMGKGEKRSFDQMEGSPAEVYVLSTSEHHSLEMAADDRPTFSYKPGNDELNINIDTKMAALKASVSVVSLVSFSGEVSVCQCSGAIIETEQTNNIVMTSLNLIRQPTEETMVKNELAANLKIVVRTMDGNAYVGEIVIYDFHYNLLIVKFKSKAPLQCAKLKMLDDDILVDKSFPLRPHSSNVKPGDPVIVVGRYFYEPFYFMVAPGNFSMRRFRPSMYDCGELLSSTCDITRCGDGAPFIDLSGEVIGVGYYDIGCDTPFLPINVAYKWWDHHKIYKELRHPSYGFEASNLYVAGPSIIEMVINRCPGISNGVLVGEVKPGSNAESAGMCEKDVIVKCDGKSVKSFFQLWDQMWNKVGQEVKLVVARVDLSTLASVSMLVGEATPDALNKWPRYDYR